MKRTSLFLALAAAWAVGTPLTAQEGFRGSGGDRGESHGGDRSSRFEGFLRSMDTNGDGVIDPSEIPESRRGMISFLASRAGIDISQPIPISKVVEGMHQRFGGSRGTPPGQPPPQGSSPSTPAASTGEKKDSASAASDSPPLVPGFGVAMNLTPVPGFGGAAASGMAASAAVGPPSAASRSYAESLMQRYDANHNGVLDKDEWTHMRRDPSAADKNGDGRITVDELAAWREERDRGGSPSSPGGPPSPGSGSSPFGGFGSFGGGFGSGPAPESGPSEEPAAGSSASTDTSPRKTYKRRSPAERLPAGLPSWFAERDADHDGQVTMAEFASSWSEEKVREFDGYDVNADGVITPQECLHVSKATASTPAAGAAVTATVGAAAAPTVGAAVAGAVPGAEPSKTAGAMQTLAKSPAPQEPAPGGSKSGDKAKPWWMTP